MIVNNYELGQSFSKKTEFGRKLFTALKEHLLALQNDLKSQGHYERVFINTDTFVDEESKIPLEILNEFLPENKKIKPKKEQAEKVKENQFNFAGWLEEAKQGRQGITQEEYEELLKTHGTARLQEQFTWDDLQALLHPDEDYDAE